MCKGLLVHVLVHSPIYMYVDQGHRQDFAWAGASTKSIHEHLGGSEGVFSRAILEN